MEMSHAFWSFSLSVMATQTSLWTICLDNILHPLAHSLSLLGEVIKWSDRTFSLRMLSWSFNLQRRLWMLFWMRIGRNTEALGFLTTASKLGLLLSVWKRKQILFNWGICDEWDHCYLDFVVETSHRGSRDSISQLNSNTVFKGYGRYNLIMKQMTPLNPNCHTRI